MNCDTILHLLGAIADRDMSAIPILADALEEMGDPRASRCRGTAKLKDDHDFRHSVRRLLLSFPDYCPSECVVRNWKVAPKMYRETLWEERDGRRVRRIVVDNQARRRHVAAQRKFKRIVKQLRIPFEYDPKTGAMVLGFPSPHQYARLKVARKWFDEVTNPTTPLFAKTD